MDIIKFGAYLKQLRLEKGISIRDVEKNINVSKAYISYLENGLRDIPSPDILKKLSTAYNVDYNVLMEKAGYINIDEICISNDNLPVELREYFDEITMLRSAYEKGLSKEDIQKLIDFAIEIKNKQK